MKLYKNKAGVIYSFAPEYPQDELKKIITQNDLVEFEAASLEQKEQVPASVTARQARLALIEAGLLDDLEEKIKQADRKILIEWEYATNVERSSALIASFAGLLGLSEERIDELFVEAAKL